MHGAGRVKAYHDSFPDCLFTTLYNAEKVCSPSLKVCCKSTTCLKRNTIWIGLLTNQISLKKSLFFMNSERGFY